MSWRFEKMFFDYMDGIQPGELVLLEYTSKEPVHLLFQMVLKYARLRKTPFLIIDVLDGLYVMHTKLKLLGIDTGDIENAPVMKIGGEMDIGNIVTKVDEITEFSIFRSRFMEAMQKIQEISGDKVFIRIVVGATELLQKMEKNSMEREAFFAGVIYPLIGNPITKGLVFLNRKRVMEMGLKEAEALSTRVLRAKMEGDTLLITVVKSAHLGEYGAEISVDPCSFRDYLISGGE